MASPSKSSPLFADLRTFVANLTDVPYDKLLSTAAEAGWQYRLVQRDIVCTPQGGALVTFDVHVGRDGVLEPFDSVSIGVPAAPQVGLYPASLIARAQITPTLIHLFFDRLPLLKPAEPPVTVVADDRDVELPGERPVAPAAPSLNVVARREPDGVPIFTDLYQLGEPTADVIGAVLDEVDDFLQRASSVEQINAMGAKNGRVIEFFRDLGEQKDIDEFMALVNERRNVLAPPKLATTPRRRGQPGRSVN